MIEIPCISRGHITTVQNALEGLRIETDDLIPSDTQAARIQSLLRSNEAPCDPEASNLAHLCARNKSFLASADQWIKQIREQMRRTLERLEQEVETQRNKSEELAGNLKLLLYPARGLPDDILGEIFLILVAKTDARLLDHYHHEYYATSTRSYLPAQAVHSLDLSVPAWTVSYVSSRWRQVALANAATLGESHISVSIGGYRWREHAACDVSPTLS